MELGGPSNEPLLEAEAAAGADVRLASSAQGNDTTGALAVTVSGRVQWRERVRRQRMLLCGLVVVAAAAPCAAAGFYMYNSRLLLSQAPKGLLSCGSKEDCLRIVDEYFLSPTRRQNFSQHAGLVQTYGPGSIGGGPCGKMCRLVEPCPNYAQAPHCRFDVYDNALAAIYLSKRGKLDEARRVLDAFIALLYPTGDVRPGLDYGAGTPLPSQRSLTLLAAGYTEVEAKAGEYNPWHSEGVADGTVDTGNNAWVGMAFAHYAAASGEPCYSLVAHDLLAALVKSTQCADDLQGFGSRLAPVPQFYRSSEHNIDMFALSAMLGFDGEGPNKRAGEFVHSMWSQLDRSAAGVGFNASYATGTGGAKRCDTSRGGPTSPAAIDAQTWNLLADADPLPERKAASMAFVVKEPSASSPRDGMWAKDTDLIGGASGLGKGAMLEGVRFTTWGNGIQWENTGSAAMAMKRYLERFDRADKLGLGKKVIAARDSIKHLLSVYRSVPASVLGGSYQAYYETGGEIFRSRYEPNKEVHEANHSEPYPGGSDTGIGWTYLRYPHTASTAWAGLLLLYQFDDGDEVNEDANPFAPPLKKVPEPHPYEKSSQICLPKQGKQPAKSKSTVGDGSACWAQPACARLHLTGECCPTAEGFLLGCCSAAASAPPAPPPVDFGSSACSAQHACAGLGLTGACCPTTDGTVLGCCYGEEQNGDQPTG